MKRSILDLFKRIVMWLPVMALITFALAIFSKLRVSDKDLVSDDPVSLIVAKSKGAAWPRLIWRRAGLIAAEYLASPSVSKAKATRIMLYCVLKVPDAPRLQLAAAEFIGQYQQQQENSFLGAEKIFTAIAERFSSNSDAQRALIRVLTRIRGKRLVREGLLKPADGESLTAAVIRAQSLQDLGDYNAADEIWRDIAAQKDMASSLLYAESLIMRGYLGKALKILKGLKSAEVGRKIDLIQTRLERAKIGDDASIYLPGVITETYFDDIRAKRENLPQPAKTEKIILINASLGRGGAERQCVNTAIEIARKRPDVSVEVWVRSLNHRKNRNALLPELKRANVKVRASDRFSSDSRDLIKRWPNLDIEQLNEDFHFLTPTLYRVYNGLREHRPDVVNLWQDATISLFGLGVLWAEVPKIALSLRSIPPPLKGTDRPYYKSLIKGIAHMTGVSVSANTQAGAVSYADWLGLDQKAVKVILNGLVRTKDMETLKEKRTVKTIVGIMRLDENKRPDAWVRVASEVLKQSDIVRFRLLGDGPLLQEVKALTSKFDIEDKVDVMGDVQDVGPFLMDADLLLHVAHVEGLPNVIIEAQAYGCAVVATDAGGAREAFIPGETGVLLENPSHLDIQTVAQSVVSLIKDSERLEAFQARAREVAIDKFSLDNMIDSTFNLYDD